MFRQCRYRLSSMSLVDRLLPYVPKTLTPIPKVARTLPDDLFEEIGEAGGLKSILSSSPEKYTVNKIDSAFVVSRKLHLKGVDDVHQQTERQKASSAGGRSHSTISPPPPQRPSSIRQLPSRTLEILPPFMVPKQALLEAANLSETEFDALRDQYPSYIDEMSFAKPHPVTYVRLHPIYSRTSGSSAELHATNQTQAVMCSKLAQYRVQDYEVFRVARHLSGRVPVPLSELQTLIDEAQVLAEPEVRPLTLVLAGDPMRFELSETYRHLDVEGSTIPTPERISLMKDELFVKYVLPPQYQLPAASVPQEHALQEMLTTVKSMAIVDRRRKRKIQRLMEYRGRCSALLDEEVFAYFVFDNMPVDGFLEVGDVNQTVFSVHPEAASTTPENFTKMFKRYPHLFFLFDGPGVNPYVQRADLPPPDIRTENDVTDEEALQSLLASLPRYRNPDLGYNTGQMGFKLPTIVKKYLKKRGHLAFLSSFPNEIQLGSGAQDTNEVEFFLKGSYLETAKADFEKAQTKAESRRLKSETLVKDRQLSKEIKHLLNGREQV